MWDFWLRGGGCLEAVASHPAPLRGQGRGVCRERGRAWGVVGESEAPCMEWGATEAVASQASRPEAAPAHPAYDSSARSRPSF